MLFYPRLQEDSGLRRVDTAGQPVNDQLPDAIRKHRALIVVGGQRMPVSNEEKAFMLLLQFDPILQHAMVMPQVQTTGRTHARQNTALGLGIGGQDASLYDSKNMTNAAHDS